MGILRVLFVKKNGRLNQDGGNGVRLGMVIGRMQWRRRIM